ncbi:MAG TPA: NAD(P)H-dependent oxidoreductase [Deltaproteobacteria bacterium]|nr:NAD(P)H-dependent oxidoreductase [Deltaproteobacteria bacterium]HOM29242.1 NAD(P)H-dependent oxidoreductase [Deltaproteobacteria bacterium]HPP79459.1 NAD(P)H-dependent oxidoreductase [Deltaproteobacteria bacterium]
MKVLALNSSPRIKGQSKTEIMLSALVSGMEDAGAEVEVVHLRTKTVKNCIGCYTCWTKTPGRCIHRDDMAEELLDKFISSDIAVFATPLYHFTMNATMKAFIERTLPVLEPFLEQKGDVTFHPLRSRHPAVVILSVAGFPEMSVFSQLSSHMRFMYRHGLIGEIYRPAAEAMVLGPYTKQREDILAATKEAGTQLVRRMRVSEKTLERIGQPLGDKTVMARAANIFWRTCMRERMTPEELRAKGVVPRPETIDDFVLIMKLAFRPENARGIDATIRFDFTGQQEGSCSLTIHDGAVDGTTTPPDRADLAVKAPFELWMDVVTGRASGADLYLKGAFKAEGDTNLLVRLGEIFGRNA